MTLVQYFCMRTTTKILAKTIPLKMRGIFELDCPTFGELLVLDGDPAGSLQGLPRVEVVALLPPPHPPPQPGGPPSPAPALTRTPAKEVLMTYCTHVALG